MDVSNSKALRGTLIAQVLLASLIVTLPLPTNRPSAKNRGVDRENRQLHECVATAPDSGWHVVEVANVATVHLPPDARSVTAPPGHTVWKLGDYGGFGFWLRSQAERISPRIIADSGAGRAGWCLNQSRNDPFVARIVVGHMYASFGRHFEALWTLPDGQELVLSGMTDTTAGNVLLQIARSVHLRQK